MQILHESFDTSNIDIVSNFSIYTYRIIDISIDKSIYRIDRAFTLHPFTSPCFLCWYWTIFVEVSTTTVSKSNRVDFSLIFSVVFNLSASYSIFHHRIEFISIVLNLSLSYGIYQYRMEFFSVVFNVSASYWFSSIALNLSVSYRTYHYRV